jgi:hypothetical protein
MRFRAYYTKDKTAVIEAGGWVSAAVEALALMDETMGQLEALETEEIGQAPTALSRDPS